MTADDPSVRVVDPRAVRVSIGSINPAGLGPIVLAPAIAGQPSGGVLVDGELASLRLERRDAAHAVLVDGQGDDAIRHPVMMFQLEPTAGSAVGPARREVIVDGWRIEVEVEPERRASLRERAVRGQAAIARDGPTEVRATIPGRVVGVSVVPGDPVTAGQQILVVEAMKMQYELRAPRDGVVASVAVGIGRTIDVGDILLVLE